MVLNTPVASWSLRLALQLSFSITNLPARTLSKRFWEDVYFQVAITIITTTITGMMLNTPVAG